MRIYKRSSTQRVVLGVCGGFAETHGWDADLVRSIWIVLGLAGGIGIIPYVAAAMLWPEADLPPGFVRPERSRRNAGLLLIGFAWVLLFRFLGIPLFPWSGGFIAIAWKLLLPSLFLGMGAFLVWPRLRDRAGLNPGNVRLVRSSSNRLLAGVCGGLGRWWGMDPNLVRVVATLLGVLSAGTLLLAYVVLVVLLPEGEESGPPPESSDPPRAAAGQAAPPEFR